MPCCTVEASAVETIGREKRPTTRPLPTLQTANEVYLKRLEQKQPLQPLIAASSAHLGRGRACSAPTAIALHNRCCSQHGMHS